MAGMSSLDGPLAEWVLDRSQLVLECARSEIVRRAAGAEQRALMERALDASNCARLPHHYHASIHLPLLVHAAVAGDDLPAVPLAAACTLLWAGAELYDDLTDGDLAACWRESAPHEIVFTATAVGAVLPPAMIAGLSAPWERRERMLADLADGLLRMFGGQALDLRFTDCAEPDPAEVEASVIGKNGAPKALFAGLAAGLAGAPAETAAAYVKFAAALGVIYQLQSDHAELFFDEGCRDLVQGTRTLHVALCLHALSGQARADLIALLDRARTIPEARAEVCRRLRHAEVMQPWARVLSRHVREAEQALAAAAPQEPAGRVLRDLIRQASPRCASLAPHAR